MTNTTQNFKIQFPIGDWSDDGHGRCENYLVNSNKSTQEVREIHFSCSEKLGFDIGKICKNYEDSELSLDVFDKLKTAGFKIEWRGENEDMCRYFPNVNDRTMGPDEVFNLWIDILMFLDSELVLIPITQDYESINFYGFDNQGRHLSTPGYGCFN